MIYKIFALFFIFFSQFFSQEIKDVSVLNSSFTFEKAVKGKEIPKEILNRIKLIEVRYFGFDEKIHKGYLVVNKIVANEVKEIFSELLEIRFPINSILPVSVFDWDDEKSMQANNTSCFNYRFIKGTTRLSKHSYGLAIDINPLFNPYIKSNSVEPEGAEYIPARKGTILQNSEAVKIFISKGWTWGGNWRKGKDYQHFEKNLK